MNNVGNVSGHIEVADTMTLVVVVVVYLLLYYIV